MRKERGSLHSVVEGQDRRLFRATSCFRTIEEPTARAARTHTCPGKAGELPSGQGQWPCWVSRWQHALFAAMWRERVATWQLSDATARAQNWRFVPRFDSTKEGTFYQGRSHRSGLLGTSHCPREGRARRRPRGACRQCYRSRHHQPGQDVHQEFCVPKSYRRYMEVTTWSRLS